MLARGLVIAAVPARAAGNVLKTDTHALQLVPDFICAGEVLVRSRRVSFLDQLIDERVIQSFSVACKPFLWVLLKQADQGRCCQ